MRVLRCGATTETIRRLVQALPLLVAVLAVCRVWTLVWLAVRAVGRQEPVRSVRVPLVKAAMVAQALMWLLVPVAAVAVLVLLVRRRRQAQAVTAVLVCKVRSPARQPFMAVERVAVRLAAPLAQAVVVAVLLALRRSAMATAGPMASAVGQVAAPETLRVATAGTAL
jgi:hypothetical protein